mgnify:CR=1 FL=1
MLSRLNSLSVLAFAGFAVAFLPLIFVIVIATTYVDELARQSTKMVTDSVAATRDTQYILEVITDLERGARQFQVVGDEELFALYRERHGSLLATLGDLRHILPETRNETAALEGTALWILEGIRDHPHDSEEVAVAVRGFEQLRAEGRGIFTQVKSLIDDDLAALRTHTADVTRSIYWLAAGLIPLAVALGVLFTALIARSVRQLGGAIHQLGEGDLERRIKVGGPLDLRDLGDRLDWLRTRLADLEREKSTFLRHVSHELKTPLANIREGAELLTDGSAGPLGERQREVMTVVRENSLALQKSIENLLHFSAWQKTRASPEKTVFGLRELVASVLSRHRLAIANGKLRIRTELPDLRINSDLEKFHVIFDNLVSNAVKFSPPGGTVMIRAGLDNSHVELLVADEGPGIPESERERVFDAFYQGSAVHHGHVRGTGIGLSVVRESVRILGGSIEICNGRTRGANFQLRFRVKDILA